MFGQRHPKQRKGESESLGIRLDQKAIAGRVGVQFSVVHQVLERVAPVTECKLRAVGTRKSEHEVESSIVITFESSFGAIEEAVRQLSLWAFISSLRRCIRLA